MIGDLVRQEPAFLVRRCFLGDAGAVQCLIAEYGDGAAVCLRRLAQHWGLSHPDLVEDAIQNLWISILEGDCQALQGYDSDRGALESYLAVQAWSLLRRERRAGGRRKRREDWRRAVRAGEDGTALEIIELDLTDVVANLPPAELAYWQQELIGSSADENMPGISDANGWQLRHRILKKIQAYLK